jgi:hypothetical protein
VACRLGETKGAKLFAEKWKNRRLPLNAIACRQAARGAAEDRMRQIGLISAGRPSSPAWTSVLVL